MMKALWLTVVYHLAITEPTFAACPNSTIKVTYTEGLGNKSVCYLILDSYEIKYIRQFIYKEPKMYGHVSSWADNVTHGEKLCNQYWKLADLNEPNSKKADGYLQQFYPDWKKWNAYNFKFTLPEVKRGRDFNESVLPALKQYMNKSLNTPQRKHLPNFQFLLSRKQKAAAAVAKPPKKGVQDLNRRVMTLDKNGKPEEACAYYVHEASSWEAQPSEQSGLYFVDCNDPYKDPRKFPGLYQQLLLCQFDEPNDCIVDESEYCDLSKDLENCLIKRRYNITKQPHPLGAPCKSKPQELQDNQLQPCKNDEERGLDITVCRRACVYSEWNWVQPCRRCAKGRRTRTVIRGEKFMGGCYGHLEDYIPCPCRGRHSTKAYGIEFIMVGCMIALYI